MAKSKLTTVPAYYVSYLDLIAEDDLDSALQSSSELWDVQAGSIPENKGDYRYADGKWTVKEVLQHIIDSERIFTYRALCIARGERKDLAGFDENMYAEQSFANKRTLTSLIEEFKLQRASTAALYSGLPSEVLKRKGNANGFVVSTELLGFVTVGHQIHHLNIIKERYL